MARVCSEETPDDPPASGSLDHPRPWPKRDQRTGKVIDVINTGDNEMTSSHDHATPLLQPVPRTPSHDYESTEPPFGLQEKNGGGGRKWHSVGRL
eukprot:764888-Hanusia_phi.AAC.1